VGRGYLARETMEGLVMVTVVEVEEEQAKLAEPQQALLQGLEVTVLVYPSQVYQRIMEEVAADVELLHVRVLLEDLVVVELAAK